MFLEEAASRELHLHSGSLIKLFEGSLKSKDKARKGLSWWCSSESQDQVFYKLLK